MNEKQKKPIVLLFVQIIAALLAITNGGALASIMKMKHSASVSLGTLLISASVVAASVAVLDGIENRRFRSRLFVSLYLWFAIVMYPVTNLMRASGYYLPGPYIADTEAMGAAVAEIVRMVVPLVLVVWVALSKKSKIYWQKAPEPKQETE